MEKKLISFKTWTSVFITEKKCRFYNYYSVCETLILANAELLKIPYAYQKKKGFWKMFRWNKQAQLASSTNKNE